MRGPKPAELADIARITARQWQQYETRLNSSNPILTGLRFLKVFENESVRTYAQAAEILSMVHFEVTHFGMVQKRRWMGFIGT